MPEAICVKMLGSFSVEKKGRCVSNPQTRVGKNWSVLAYLIYFRKNPIVQKDLFDLFDASGDYDPAAMVGRLKTLICRMRDILDNVEENAGQNWIRFEDGAYCWNKDVTVQLDCEKFKKLCETAASAEDEDKQLKIYTRALKLYEDDFLSKLPEESWIKPIREYYHGLYLDAVRKTLTLMEARQMWPQAIQLCRKALKIDRNQEDLYQCLMRCYLAVGDNAGALSAFDKLGQMLASVFGRMPSGKSRKLYKQASSAKKKNIVSLEDMRNLLQESAKEKGALLCGYEYFRQIYQVQSSVMSRDRAAVHMALFSLFAKERTELTDQSLKHTMDDLTKLAVDKLDKSDVVTKCSVSQLLVMMPLSNYETSHISCQNILDAFQQQYPDAPVDIQYTVKQLEPIDLFASTRSG